MKGLKLRGRKILDLVIPKWVFIVIFGFWLPVSNIIINLFVWIPIIGGFIGVIWFLFVEPTRSIFQYYFESIYQLPNIYPLTGGTPFTTLPFAILFYIILALLILLFKKDKITLRYTIFSLLLIQLIILVLSIKLGVFLYGFE